MNPATTNLIVGFANDFIIVAGSIITGAMMATKEVSLPNTAVILLALISGVVQAARRAQSKVEPSVTKPDAAANAMNQVTTNDQAVAAIADAISQAIYTPRAPEAPLPVTPQRVAPPVKDSS
jgi:hypothetical protein